MSKAVVAISPKGVELARKLNKQMVCDIYVLEKYKGEGCNSFNCTLSQLAYNLFKNYREIVMIMSTGIAVRAIAPHIRDKTYDPAIVVLDDSGKFSISLLSGHIGGANKLAQYVAGIIRAMPVVTTSSDNHGIEAVDMLAKRLDLSISDLEDAKLITAIMLNGGKVGVICDCDGLREFLQGYRLTSRDTFESENLDGIIYIGNSKKLFKENGIPFVKLTAKNIVIGAGCKKGIPAEYFEKALDEFLDDNNVDKLSVKGIATVEIKRDEKAICSLAEKRGWELDFITLEEIKKVQHLFSKSKFVEKVLGVGGVCEPCAYIASNMGKCISPKKTTSGIALCIYECMC